MTPNIGRRSRSQASNSSENSWCAPGRSLPLGTYKWIILLSTFFINVIVPSILPSLGVLLYFELQDPRVSLSQAIWTPIFFIVSWCLADSWGQTAAITEGFQKVAIAASFIAGSSVAATSSIHHSYGSLTSLFLIGMIVGAGSRLLMTISENILSAHFSSKSKPALMVTFLANQSISLILPPVIIAYVAKTDGIHYALLMLGALILQTLPTAFLLKKPKPLHTSHHLYLTTQPAYALLHNDIDDDEDDNEEETDVAPNQPDYYDIPQRNYEYRMNVDTTIISEQRTETDNTPIPLFTNVDLVAGTYQGDVAFSFEDNQRNESNMNEDVDIFVCGLTGHQRTKQRPWSCCFRCFKSKSFQKEFHPLAHPAFYLGLISMLAQKLVALAVWILLPALITIFPHINIHGYEFSVSKVGVAIVSMLTGLAAIPVMFFIPTLLHPSSYAGRRMIHGIATVVAALGVYAIGRSLNILQIGALLFFGLSNAASVSTLEPLFKEALLGSDLFLGYKSRERDWGKIRGLANTLTGVLILTIGLAIDIVITDWNHIDWSLVFYLIATFQAFAGLIWIIVPSAYCH